MNWVELLKWIALPGVGAIVLAIVQHFLGSRSRRVNNTVKIGKAWSELADQLRARIQSLEERIQVLEDENEILARKVEQLSEENLAFGGQCTRIRSLEKENEALRVENREFESDEGA